MLTRELHRIDRAVREGQWHCPRGTSLAGKTFGVIGVGSIGSAVARRANAAEMTVLGSDIRPLPKDLVEAIDIERVPREELLDRSNVVSLNCALTESTRGMIGPAELDRLGESGYLINTASGALIDQPALIAALEEGQIAGAALDVFSDEPLPSDSPLIDVDSAILGSHNAQNTAEAVADVNDRAVDSSSTG